MPVAAVLLAAAVVLPLAYVIAREATTPPNVWRESATVGRPLPTQSSPSEQPSPTPSLSPTTSPTPTPDGDGRTTALLNRGAEKCLDDPRGNADNGTEVIIWDCHGQSNQSWTLTATGELQVVGKCLDTAEKGFKRRTRIVIWDCDGSASQRWVVNSDGTIMGAQSLLCLDLVDGKTTNDTKLELDRCRGNQRQTWSRG